MKKIDTTNIAGLAKAPFIKATHDHIKESIQENDSDIIKGLIGTYTTNDLIILYGCVVTAIIPGTSSITAGAIYYNGEIYQVDADASIITTGSDTLVWEVITTYRSGDPVAWSDGTDRDLHRVDKLQLDAGASGSGLANYDGATVKTLPTQIVSATNTDTWHLIGGVGEPALQNSWVDANSFTIIDTYPLQFTKDGSGIVHLRGAIGLGTVSTTMFTLPVGYRPATLILINVYATEGGVYFPGQLLIGSDGTVAFPPAANDYISFGGVSFKIN
jgi:hypothetical protein